MIFFHGKLGGTAEIPSLLEGTVFLLPVSEFSGRVEYQLIILIKGEIDHGYERKTSGTG